MQKIVYLCLLLLGTLPSLQAQETTTLSTLVNTLKERIHLAGYAQLGYTYDDAATPNNTFDVKRIIFMAHGQITDRWSCDFMYDFYNSGMLLELYTDYRLLPGLTARVGEFKIPFSIENGLSPTQVELINCYSQAVCYLAGVSGSDRCYGLTSGRDIGFMLHGKLLRERLQYQIAVVNGQGLNTRDKNSHKDLVGSLLYSPLAWLSVGGSFIHGTGHAIADSEYSGIKTGENYAKRRWAVGCLAELPGLDLRAEYLRGKDRTVKSEGFYTTGTLNLTQQLDLVGSYDYFCPNRSANYSQHNYTAGMQYWFYPRCRLQAQYTYCHRTGADRRDSNLVQMQVQVRF